MVVLIKSEVLRLLRALINSLDGWKFMLREYNNIKYLSALILLTPILAFVFEIEIPGMLLLLLVMVTVTGFEIINTVIEEMLDMMVPHYSSRIKNLKDMLSGTVYLGLIIYVLFFGLLIYLNHF